MSESSRLSSRLGIIILLVICALSAGYVLHSDLVQHKATTLTQRERISMCNARGGIYADGVCQRIYINLCRRL